MERADVVSTLIRLTCDIKQNRIESGCAAEILRGLADELEK